MALIRKTVERPAVPARNEWDPFRMMERMLGWDPLRGYEGGYRGAPLLGNLANFEERAYLANFDVKETKDSYVFKGDLPGIKEADLDISLVGNVLTITGKRDAENREEHENWYAVERTHGSFTRSFTLPDSADTEHVKAEMKDGVLTMVLPKKPEMQPRKISVAVSKDTPKH